MSPEGKLRARGGTVDGDPMLGRRLGDFVVRGKLGEGGFGVVYLAEQPALEREAVIKVLRSQHLRSAATDRFLREAKLASKLDHPYAAHVYAFGAEQDGVLWIAMELVKGTPLDELLATQGPLSLERFAPLLDRICEVVHTAHEHGLVHRDLKPANVMVLSRAGRLLPKLLDFGIACLADHHDPDGVAQTGEVSPELGAVAAEGAGLTGDAFALGSPAYMAPEQWVSPADADARADVYALGILTYEALTGAPPFRGKTLLGVARAHARRRVPPLGKGFPESLDAVLRDALAKRRADRLDNALELATRFRDAAGLAVLHSALPAIEESVRDAMVQSAPQPIAEAVAALDASRNMHHAREAMWELAHIVTHYLGVLAMSCRSRIGGVGGEDTPRVVASLRQLRRGALTAQDWLTLTVDLVKPFRSRRDAFPIPELVDVARPDGPLMRALAALHDLKARSEHSVGASDDEVLDSLRQAADHATVALEELRFLLDYALVVRRADGAAERWMGARRTTRRVLDATPRQLEVDRPSVVDADGAPVLSLWPLAQVHSPVPGAARELFLLEGRAPSGARLASPPHGFEHFDPELWEWFRDHLLDAADADASAASIRAPYRGLEPFTAEDAERFIGRERDVELLMNKLRMEPFVTVVGPSGVGKSSLVHAGLVPAISDRASAIGVRPGSEPLVALGAKLGSCGIELGNLRARLEEDVGALGQALRDHADREGKQVVLVIDQFEETFTLCHEEAARKLFADALAHAARVVEEDVRVIITLRDDFLIRAEELAALRSRIAPGIQLVTTPAKPELMRILVEPARHAGYQFEDGDLPTQMVEEVEGRPGALALLSFTAAKLWELRDRHFMQLTRRAYKGLGGVGGALSAHADEMLHGMYPDEQRLVREAFRHLVTSDGTRTVLRREDLLHVIGGGARASSVVEKLVSARLLVASEGETGADQVEITHEALIAGWPLLQNWLREDAEGARFRDQLREAVRQWDDRERPAGLLWRGDALAEYRRWRALYPGQLTPSEQEFVDLGEAEAVRARRLRRTLTLAAFVALAVGTVALAWMNRVASEQRGLARDNAERAQTALADSYLEQGRQLSLDGDHLRALPYLVAGAEIGADGDGLAYLLARAALELEEERAVLWHETVVRSVKFDPSGTRVVTAAGQGSFVWDAVTGKLIRQLDGDSTPVWWAEFSPDGTRVVTASEDMRARVWNAASGELMFAVEHHRSVRRARFSPDGALIVTASRDRTARIWDAGSGEAIAELAHEDHVFDAEFDRSGSRVVTASMDGTAKLWSARGELLHTLDPKAGFVIRATFDPSGRRVATASDDGRVRLWDVASGRLLRELEGHEDSLMDVAFVGQGSLVISGALDGTSRLWSADTGTQVAVAEHAGHVIAIDVSPGGEWAVVTGRQQTIAVWDIQKQRVVDELIGHFDVIRRAAFSPDGTLVATASEDRSARVWSVGGKSVVIQSTDRAGNVEYAGIDPDMRLLTHARDGTTTLWDTASGVELPAEPDEHIRRAVHWPKQLALTTTSTGHVIRSNETGESVARLDLLTQLRQAQFSRNGEQIVVSNLTDTFTVFDARTGELTTATKTPSLVVEATFSPDGSFVATAGEDGVLRVWEASGGALRFEVAGSESLESVAFSSDGSLVAAGAVDGTVRVWNTADRALVSSLEGHGGRVAPIQFTPKGSLLMTGADDGRVRLFAARTGRLLSDLQTTSTRLTQIGFASDGSIAFAIGLEGEVMAWRMPVRAPSGAELRAILSCRVPFVLQDGSLVKRPPTKETCPGSDGQKSRHAVH